MAEANADAFSNLPDEMLVKILSHLPGTKQRATTSILSRRWCHLWTLVPSLDFEEDDSFSLPWPRAVTECFSCLDLCPHATLSLRRLAIGIFSRYLPKAEQIDRWLSFAAFRSLHELCIRKIKGLTLPPSLPRLRDSLRVLALQSCRLPRIDAASLAASGFPFLHTLVLHRVQMADHQFQALINACPALEHLQIRSRELPAIRISSSANPRLTDIEILGAYRINRRRLTIEVSTLQSLVVSGFGMDDLHLGNSPLLREVGLFPEDHASWNNITIIPPAVQCAEILSAGGQIFQHLSKLDFENLKILYVMEFPSERSYKYLMAFLLQSSSLQTIYFNCMRGYMHREPCGKWSEWEYSKIKSITFVRFMNREHEMQLLEYFLANVASLDHVHVAFEHGFNQSPDVFTEKVSRFPTASSYVNIVTSECRSYDLQSVVHPLLNQKSCFDVWA